MSNPVLSRQFYKAAILLLLVFLTVYYMLNVQTYILSKMSIESTPNAEGAIRKRSFTSTNGRSIINSTQGNTKSTNGMILGNISRSKLETTEHTQFRSSSSASSSMRSENLNVSKSTFVPSSSTSPENSSHGAEVNAINDSVDSTPLPLANNEKCLRYLLENNIVEYYYAPDNDENNLNFTTRGVRTKKRLINETSKPLLVILFVPSDVYNETVLPKHICPWEIGYFMPNMRAQDYDILRNLIKFFKYVAALSGMDYFLNYGSLLGHIRFNKRPIPWDDDVDFSVDYSMFNRFKRIFSRERKLYIENSTFLPTLNVAKDRVKLYDLTQSRTHSYQWRFPCIDLFFFTLPDVDFYDERAKDMDSYFLNEAYLSIYELNVSLPLILPLKKEIFLGVEVTVPLNSMIVMEMRNYEKDFCAPLHYSHRFERGRKSNYIGPIDCNQLKGFYDF